MSVADYMFGLFRKRYMMPSPEEALPGRDDPIRIEEPHAVLHTPVMPEYPEGTQLATFGMGCFWGVEKLFWQQEGVYTTAVGYSGGYTQNPTYEDVCSGKTGHNEVVRVVYWPNQIRYERLLYLFWSNHNPTQGMRQGNDRGTQYRSAIYFHSEQQRVSAIQSLKHYQDQLKSSNNGDAPDVTTEIVAAGPFYFAEPYHQQYLAKNPDGYCNMQDYRKTGLPDPEEL